MSLSYEDVQAQIEKLKRDQIRAETLLEENYRILKEEFGVSTIKAGKKLLEKMKAEESEARETFERQFEEFVAEHGDFLRQEDD